ncbi:hypothetical protein [Nocardia sp. CA-119907]|uniref:hypothetical protein n=1 Tax=Nocardia sp. CA-119907 TaxID=3239973 RepID=UPI003D99A4C0
MKIHCRCGATIHDGGDGLPTKAHLIPDANKFDLWDQLDALIDAVADQTMDREQAHNRARELFRVQRPIWQCAECGRLYLDDLHDRRKLHVFRPEDSTVTDTLAAAPRR